MRLLKEEYEKLPDKICLYRNPKKSTLGIPVPVIFSKEDGRYSPRTKKIDALDNLSLIFINLGIILSLIPGVVLPWILVGTIPMIIIGIICLIALYHCTKLEYCRLYQVSLTEKQKQRKSLFFKWLNENQSKIRDIKSKPLSEITMEDQEFVKRTEDIIRGLEWL